MLAAATVAAVGSLLYRWPWPSDVREVYEDAGLRLEELRRRRPDLPSRTWRSCGPHEAKYRLRFLAEQLGRNVDCDCLQSHPQYLWSRFDRHILPRVLYARQLNVDDTIRLSDLLGTPDLEDRAAESRGWPAVCGEGATRSDYEGICAAIKTFAAEVSISDVDLLGLCVDNGLSHVAERCRLAAPTSRSSIFRVPIARTPPPSMAHREIGRRSTRRQSLGAEEVGDVNERIEEVGTDPRRRWRATKAKGNRRNRRYENRLLQGMASQFEDNDEEI
jgi:hypothetical protein